MEEIFLLCPQTTPIWFSLDFCVVPTKENTTNLNVWLANFLDPSSPDYPRANGPFGRF